MRVRVEPGHIVAEGDRQPFESVGAGVSKALLPGLDGPEAMSGLARKPFLREPCVVPCLRDPEADTHTHAT